MGRQAALGALLRGVPQDDVVNLLAPIEKLLSLGHSSIPDAEQFQASLKATLGDGTEATSPRRNPLAVRMSADAIRETLSCIESLVRHGVTSVHSLEETATDIRRLAKGLTRPAADDALGYALSDHSRDNDDDHQHSGNGGYDTQSPLDKSDKFSGAENFDNEDEEDPAEWHDDAEKAFEGEYRFVDCHLCQEMIADDGFRSHWANDCPPKDNTLRRKTAREDGRVVRETTTVCKGEDAAGNKMINEYTCIAELGKGSYGKVKLVMHVPTGQYFAIKIMNKSVLKSVKKGPLGGQTALDDVKREIAIMKRCNHPNVCSLHEVINDEEESKLYLIVDYYEKGALVHIQDDNTIVGAQLPVEKIRKYATGICQGLDYLHHNHIVHRDVKPDNILVGSDGEVRLTDFGVSHSGTPGAYVDDTDGTPAFLSPEQIRSEKIIGHMADLWATGVTIYVLTYGRLPHLADNMKELSRLITEVEPAWEETDRDLLDLMQQVMNKNMSERLGGQSGARDLLRHPFLAAHPGAVLQEHSAPIQVTDKDTTNAVLPGYGIRLDVGTTVGVMMQLKGAVKGFKGLATKSPPGSTTSISPVRPPKPMPDGSSRAGPGLIIVSDLSEGRASPKKKTGKNSDKLDLQDTLPTSVINGDDESDSDDGRGDHSLNTTTRSFRGTTIRHGGSYASLCPKRSFRTEEEVVMEDMSADDLVKICESTSASGDTEIVLNCFKFDTIPDVLFQCSHLQSLTSSMNGMRTVPEAFGERLQNLTTLNLSQNHIVSVPASLGLLRKLTRLDLNRNDITSVPDALANLKQLKVANFDYNELDAIPSCLCRIANLEQCYVAQNEGIATIPLEAKNWKMCQLAVTNTPKLLREWKKICQLFPNIKVLWNKVYPDALSETLFIGSLRTAQNEHVLRELSITRIVSCGKGLVVIDPIPDGIEQMVLNIDDNPDQKLTPLFNKVADYIEGVLEEDHRVLVHCFAGLSRSVALVCAYLMKTRRMTFKNAITLVKKSRPAANPNDGFRQQLIQYEDDLYGTRLDPEDVENYSNGPAVEPECKE